MLRIHDYPSLTYLLSIPLSRTRLRIILIIDEELLESSFISVDEGSSMHDGARIYKVPFSSDRKLRKYKNPSPLKLNTRTSLTKEEEDLVASLIFEYSSFSHALRK